MSQQYYFFRQKDYLQRIRLAAISSRKLADAREGHVGNFNFYNDKELFEEARLNWYDYGFRNYDPQIGRFPQLDPLTNEYPSYPPTSMRDAIPLSMSIWMGWSHIRIHLRSLLYL